MTQPARASRGLRGAILDFAHCPNAGEGRNHIRPKHGEAHPKPPGGQHVAAQNCIAVIDGDKDRLGHDGVFEGAFDYQGLQCDSERLFHSAPCRLHRLHNLLGFKPHFVVRIDVGEANLAARLRHKHRRVR